LTLAKLSFEQRRANEAAFPIGMGTARIGKPLAQEVHTGPCIQPDAGLSHLQECFHPTQMEYDRSFSD
jgi:hypothetical protein